jgi:hypothetical protein
MNPDREERADEATNRGRRRRPSRWYAAAPGRTYVPPVEKVGGTSPTLHAKEPGSHRTACGLSTDTWSLSWELPFDVHAEWACPSCAAEVSTTAALASADGPGARAGGE